MKEEGWRGWRERKGGGGHPSRKAMKDTVFVTCYHGPPPRGHTFFHSSPFSFFCVHCAYGMAIPLSLSLPISLLLSLCYSPPPGRRSHPPAHTHPYSTPTRVLLEREEKGMGGGG
eukprot:Sspe_Gene.102676::Locus_78530_Transcript_1_1_Confidence_1.000_Length_560::g.102676::m.102676